LRPPSPGSPKKAKTLFIREVLTMSGIGEILDVLEAVTKRGKSDLIIEGTP
jgi:hypothetical protein